MLGGKNAVLHILHSNNFYGYSVSWPEKWALDSFQNIGKERKIAKDEGKKGGKYSKMQDLFYEQFLSMSQNPGNQNKILDALKSWGHGSVGLTVSTQSRIMDEHEISW